MPKSSPQVIHFVVPVELSGKTLAAAIKQLHAVSWAIAKHLLQQRQVAVNGVVCIEEARRLAAGDQVEISDRPINRPVQQEDVTIYHLDDDVIVLEKPAGVISLRHAREIDWPYEKRRQQPTLDEIALTKIGSLLRPPQDFNKWPPKRRRQNVRAVHRIDRETSGLVVFARNVEAERNLIAQFAAHTVERVYLTVCWGQVTSGTVKSQFIRDRGDGIRGSTPNEHEGKVAVTHFRYLERLGQHSLVECRLETGRTHQIRIHLAEAGHPLCGDPVYRAGFGQAPIADITAAPRLALHAHRLEFTHPRLGDRLRFESPWPKDLQQLVNQVRS